jgi:phosphinothricin acetyltransferase
MRSEDWAGVRRVYEEGIATRIATMETQVPEFERWDRTHLAGGRLVARLAGSDEVVGWVSLSPVSSRQVYAGVAEVSIYVGAGHRGRGIGRTLLERLIAESETLGIWTLQSGIFPENHPSLALHQNCGFRVIGVREKIGLREGVWRDLVLMERRSRTVGVE